MTPREAAEAMREAAIEIVRNLSLESVMRVDSTDTVRVCEYVVAAIRALPCPSKPTAHQSESDDVDREVERILALSDEEIIAEVCARGEDPAQVAQEMHAMFNRIVEADDMHKLLERALKWVDAGTAESPEASVLSTDIRHALSTPQAPLRRPSPTPYVLASMTQTPREAAEAIANVLAKHQVCLAPNRDDGVCDPIKGHTCFCRTVACDILTALPAAPSEPTAFEWAEVETVDEMQVFFRSRLAAIREAAKEHGYAIAVHGSERRDFDLVAIPWVDNYSSRDVLARAINKAACGLEETEYRWKEKPNGRVAVSIPVCWPGDGMPHEQLSLGCIDLSVTPPEPTAEGQDAQIPCDDEWSNHPCRRVDRAVRSANDLAAIATQQTAELTTLRADLARMKAAMEGAQAELVKGRPRHIALATLTAALKGTAP